MAKQFNAFGGDAEPEVTLEPEKQDEQTLINAQWSAYTRARDSGHLVYVEEAQKFDNYYFGRQWEDEVKQALDAQGRPSHTVNLILSTVNSVTGEYIKSRQDISFVPTGKGASDEVGKSLRFLFKQIALNNDSEQKEKMVFEDGLIQDRGYFYYFLDFSDNLQGEIREMVLDPTDVILDSNASEYDPDTWSEVWVSRWMTPEEISAMYGPKKGEQVSLAGSGTFGHDSIEFEAPTFGGDRHDAEVFFTSDQEETKRVKRVRVIERQYRKLTRTGFFIDVEDGDMRRIPEGWDVERVKEFAELHGLEMFWKPERRVRITISADRVLLHDDWSLFNKFSVVPFFPYFRRGRPFGMVRNLISPQDMLNKVTSQELHVVNTTANSGWIFQSGSLVNMDRDDLVQQGSKTGLVLEYTAGADKPEKIQPNTVPTGLSEISAKAGLHFREISGVNEALLGSGRSDSSKALDSRKTGGLVQQEIIFDNLDLTRKYRARLMLEIVQSYYTDTRLIKIIEKNELGDDVPAEISINQPIEVIDPETGESIDEIMNDLTLGEYSVAVTTVPRRDTYDEALFDQLIQMREAGVPIPNYVLTENSSLPDRKEVAEIIKQQEGLAAPTEAEVERAQRLDDLQMQLLEAQVANERAEGMEREANAQKLLAQGADYESGQETERLKIGTNARVEMERVGLQHQSNREDLMTRINLMQQKNQSGEKVAQIGSMTKRVTAGLDRRGSLTETLIKSQDKERTRSAVKE